MDLEKIHEEMKKLAGTNDEWISVQDRLPDVKVVPGRLNSVLVTAFDGYNVTAARYVADGYCKRPKDQQPKWKTADGARLFWGEITHWRPMPSPPVNVYKNQNTVI